MLCMLEQLSVLVVNQDCRVREMETGFLACPSENPFRTVLLITHPCVGFEGLSNIVLLSIQVPVRFPKSLKLIAGSVPLP